MTYNAAPVATVDTSMRKPIITLRTAVILPFLAVLLLTVTVITFLQKHSYEKMISEISHKQLNTISQNVDSNLSSFLYGPYKLSLALSQSVIYNNLYDANDLTHLSKYMRASYTNIHSQMPQLFILKFASEKHGHFIGFRSDDDQQLSLIKKDATTNGDLHIYSGDNDNSALRSVVENYNPKIRPWYQPAVKAGKTVWSVPYVDQDERHDVSLSASTPLYQNGQLLGVFSADVRITSFSDFLVEQKKLNHTTIFIFDSNKHIIASSNNIGKITGKSLHASPTSAINKQIIKNSDAPIIGQTMDQIEINNIDLTRSQDFSFKIDGERYFSYTIPFKDKHGIEWTIALSTPESTLLGSLPQQQKNVLWFGLLAGLIASILGYIVFSRVTRTLKDTAQVANKISEGDWDTQTLPKPGYLHETNVLVETFANMTTKLKQSFDHLKEQLHYDSLTKLYTRHGLVETYNHTSASQSGMLMAIGIERFRDINDSFGHYKGDKALLVISQCLKEIKNTHQILSRSSGAEFILYIPTQDEKEIDAIAEQIHDKFMHPLQVGSQTILITPVLGLARVDQGDDLYNSITKASIALSNAKKSAEKLVYYSQEMADESEKRIKTIAEINQAINNDEFVPFYQSIVDVKTHEVIGVEALARWVSPTKGLIPPFDFIPTAEEYGLIKHIGHQILLKACVDTQKAISSGIWSQDFHLHVNISVKQLEQEQFVQDVRDILQQSQLPVKHLTLEVTESNMVDNDNTIMRNMKALQDLGIGIAIDDFGTGYSSLSYLHKLPFNCLKIDRSFIRDLNAENAPSSIAAIILGMAKNMNVTVVSEGVETEGQAQILRDLGCQHAQGFLYAKPQPFSEHLKQI